MLIVMRPSSPRVPGIHSFRRALPSILFVLLLCPALGHAQDAADQPLDSLPAQIGELRSEVGRLSATVDSLARTLQTRGVAAEAVVVESTGEAVTLEAAQAEARRLGLRALLAVVVLVLTSFVVRLLSWTLGQLAERTVQRRLFFKRIEPVVRIAVWALGGVIVLRGVFDLEASTLITAGAAIGVAVGFAAQDILKNIFGGLVILADRPFQVGDKISVGGTYGEVTAIGLRSTRLVTPDDSLVSVPNAQIVDGQVSNANAGALDCQVVTELHLPGWVDTRAARAIAYRAAATSRFVYREKPIVVLARDQFDETFYTKLQVKAYVLDIRFEAAFMSDVTERARDGFKEAGLLPEWFGATPRVSLPVEWTSTP